MKYYRVVFLVGALFLAGCQASTPSTESVSEHSASSYQETQATSTIQEEMGEQEPSTENKNVVDQGMDEATYLSEHLPLEELDSITLTDNRNKRVLLFSDDSGERYKSIYLKQKRWLKIVSLTDDELIFNQEI
ncbi:hypothetical protein IV487_03200 [Enterococcus saccharolyticus]|uniref:Lipoprotein n=1 Tax=Candidatus Enterococcus willemsii TaxID=1857215 RepID=A0ABQ6Z2M0_9ENTE|nr:MULTISPECIES: hypothetical protein [Enterococcus]KAF1305714.1 hypothetical protein BAU17_00245 [Enterococcus sp. CU12B]MCD5001474.1 hypothetical protein [Enterococcus saccharolyticus]